jgi:hypothetical protein
MRMDLLKPRCESDLLSSDLKECDWRAALVNKGDCLFQEISVRAQGVMQRNLRARELVGNVEPVRCWGDHARVFASENSITCGDLEGQGGSLVGFPSQDIGDGV